MPCPAATPITRLLDAHTNSTRHAVSERLIDALRKYESDSDVASLRRTFLRYQTHQEELKKPVPMMRAILHAFGSFNIAPANSYKRYMSALKYQSDADAIKADWEMVGEDLSYAFIQHIIAERPTDE